MTKLTNVPMVLIHVIIMLHVPILLEASPVAAMLVSAVMAQFALTLTSVSLELIVATKMPFVPTTKAALHVPVLMDFPGTGTLVKM